MSDNIIDVQLYPKGIVIALPDEAFDCNLPGTVNMTHDEADMLRDQLNEAWLNQRGLQPLSIPWSEVQEGDIIPAFGKTAVGSPFPTDTDRTHGKLYLVGCGSITLPFSIEVTVHRRID